MSLANLVFSICVEHVSSSVVSIPALFDAQQGAEPLLMAFLFSLRHRLV